MKTVTVDEAKTDLSQLIDEAAAGEPFIIARAGKPLVKVVAIDTPAPLVRRRLGALEGRFNVPDDFDTMGSTEIERMFGVADD